VSSENPKHALLAQFATVAKALSHSFRLELLESLAQGERSVESLAQRAGLTMGNASQHLQQLRRAGLVASRREGKHIYYRLADAEVVALLAGLRHIAERNIAEVRRIVDSYFHRLDDLDPVSRQELVARLRDGLVTLLDVRPGDEFAAGHLPGAVNIPLRDLEARLAELDPGRDIIAYCRGPYCVLSFEAIALLRRRGFNIRRLQDGFPEWAAAGLPVEMHANRG
jgi:ArsR family transcriptional regulator